MKITLKLPALLMTAGAAVTLIGAIFGNTSWLAVFYSATSAWFAWMVVHVDGRNRPNVVLSGARDGVDGA